MEQEFYWDWVKLAISKMENGKTAGSSGSGG